MNFRKICILVFGCVVYTTSVTVHAAPKNEKSSEPINITSEELRVFKTRNSAEFLGHVHAVQGDMNLFCDKMTVFFESKKVEQKKTDENTDEMGKSKVEKIKCVGNVSIITPEESAKSEFGDYDVKSGIFTLTEKVELYQKKNKLFGSKLIYNKNTGESLLTSSVDGKAHKNERVKAILIPEEKSEEKTGN